MAIELVDGFAGHPHISSEDLAALNKGTIGAKDCVFDYGDKFKCTMETANKAVIGTGAGMVGGLRFWSKSSTDLTVQSGSQGMKRHDLVVARYKKDSGTQIESVALEVVKGAPHASSPADPAVGADGMALWRIPIDGITPGAPVMVANVTPSIQALRDSVSQSPRVVVGTKVLQVTTSNPTPILFTADEYKRLAGHPYSSATDHVSVANGDWSAMEAHVGGSIYGGGNVYVSLSRQAPKNGSLRIDYAIIIHAG